MIRLIEVPDGAEWIDLVDCLRPLLSLHALELPLPTGRPIAFNADWLADLAEQRVWPGVEIRGQIA